MNRISGLLRKQTGLTQEQLAAFAGVDRSHLARVEAGTKGVGHTAALPLLWLHEAAATVSVSRSITEAHSDPGHRQDCQQQALVFHHRCRRLERKLQAMETCYLQACRLQQCLEVMKTKAITGLSARQLRWIEEQEYQASLKMERHGPAAQQKLRLAIRLAKAMAEVYGKE